MKQEPALQMMNRNLNPHVFYTRMSVNMIEID